MSAVPRIVLGLAYACALSVPCLPALVHLLQPPPVLRRPETPQDLALGIVQVAATAGHGARTALLMLGLAALAVTLALCAWWLCHRAPPGAAAQCPAAGWIWAPIPLALAGLVLGLLVQDLLLAGR
jgi:hypothetical protein